MPKRPRGTGLRIFVASTEMEAAMSTGCTAPGLDCAVSDPGDEEQLANTSQETAAPKMLARESLLIVGNPKGEREQYTWAVNNFTSHVRITRENRCTPCLRTGAKYLVSPAQPRYLFWCRPTTNN